MNKSTVLLALCACASIACGRSNDTDTGSNAPSTDTATHNEAVRKIAMSRCQREQACNNIGDGRKYDSQDACESEVTQNTRSTLRPSECPAIIQSRLDNCIDEVKNQACNNPIDEVSRLAACRQGELCMSMRDESR